METLPALLLLAAVAALGARMLWLQLSLDRQDRRHEAATGAFANVWEDWRRSGGQAAMAGY